MLSSGVRIFVALVSFLFMTGIGADAASLEEQGLAEYRAENYEEALDSLLRAADQDPRSSQIAYYLGLCYKQTGEYRKAVTHLMAALTLTPPVKEAYPDLIEALYALNELDEAMQWAAEAERAGVRPGHIAYLKGLVYAKRNETAEALASFRKAKELDPSFRQSADFQIAVIYSKDRKYQEAKQSLRALIETDPTSDLAAFAGEYERAVTRTAEAYKPWKLSAGLAYQYDSNVILAPGGAVPGLAPSGKSDSSIVGTLRAEYNAPASGPWLLSARYNFYSNTYFKITDYNSISQTLSVVPGYSFGKSAVYLPLFYNYVLFDSKGYLSMITARPTVSYIVAPDHIVQASLGYELRDFLYNIPSSAEDRDGNVYYASVGYYRPFAGGKGMFTLKYEYAYDDAQGSNWGNSGNRFNASLLSPVTKDLSVIINGDVFIQDYRNVNSYYGIKRKDTTYLAGVALVYEILKGFTLNLQYVYMKDDSNITIYNYDRHLITAGAEYTF